MPSKELSIFWGVPPLLSMHTNLKFHAASTTYVSVKEPSCLAIGGREAERTRKGKRQLRVGSEGNIHKSDLRTSKRLRTRSTHSVWRDGGLGGLQGTDQGAA